MTDAKEKSRILVVEDEAIVAADIQDRLTALGYQVVGTTGNGEEAVRLAARVHPNVVLMDIILDSTMDGVQAADLIRKDHDIPVIFLTAHSDEKTLQRARISEPFGYIVKPFEEHSLHATIQMSLYRHRSEQNVRRMERWLTTTLRSIGDGVIAIDLSGRITFMNLVAQSLTGWPLSEALGLPCEVVLRLINERSRETVANPAQTALREGLIIELAPETLLINRQGNEVNIEDTAAPIRDDRGNVVGAVIVFRNATDRRKSELALQNLNRSLATALSAASQQEKASRQDMEFLTHAISHDLRSPLAALKIDAQMLGQGYMHALGKEGFDIVDGISQSIARMEALISSYLQFTREKNPVGVRCEPVDMKALVNEVIFDLHQSVGSRAVDFAVRNLPPAEGDPALLRQVWTNLLSNAVKYTRVRQDAKIAITGRREAGESLYEIADNGIGFDPAQAGKLFTDYQRLHAASGIEGVGLGLSVVKQIVERHGGRVWATGQPDAGATFGFSLPSNSVPKSTS